MSELRIAYLILCHQDPKHIGRLARRLSSYADVFIHVDKKMDIRHFLKESDCRNIYFIPNRVRAYWGSWNAVKAVMNLLEYASQTNRYDRYIVLQGLDYPIKSDTYIIDFFKKNKDVEFIRGCNTSIEEKYYFRDKCKSYYIYNTDCPLRKMWNLLIRFLVKDLHIDIRKGYVIDGKRYDVYWGAAQFAITGECADYILKFAKSHEKFNKFFYHVYPADETYSQSIIMNSQFVEKTVAGKADQPIQGLTNHRNLHFFKYDGQICVFTAEDYDMLMGRSELFCRKVNSEKSSDLLDKLDGMEKYEKD